MTVPISARRSWLVVPAHQPQDPPAGAPVALGGVLPHKHTVVQHPDGQLVVMGLLAHTPEPTCLHADPPQEGAAPAPVHGPTSAPAAPSAARQQPLRRPYTTPGSAPAAPYAARRQPLPAEPDPQQGVVEQTRALTPFGHHHAPPRRRWQPRRHLVHPYRLGRHRGLGRRPAALVQLGDAADEVGERLEPRVVDACGGAGAVPAGGVLDLPHGRASASAGAGGGAGTVGQSGGRTWAG